MAKQLYNHNSFNGGQYDRELLGKVPNGMSYCRNVLSSPKGELRARTGTKFLMDLPSDAVIVPYRYGEKDLACIYTDSTMELFEYNEAGDFVPYTGYTSEKFNQTWTSNTTDGWSVASPTTGNDANPYNNELYKAFNTITGDGRHFEGVGAQFSTKRTTANKDANSWISIESPEPIFLGKVNIQFVHVAKGAPSTEQYVGFADAVIQFSDDGETWQPIQTTLMSYNKLGAYFGKYHYGLSSTERTEYYILYNLIPGESDKHKYWRIYFTDYRYPANYVSATWTGIVVSFETKQEYEHQTYTTDITADKIRDIKYSQYQYDQKIFVKGTKVKSLQVLSGEVTFNNAWTPTPSNFYNVQGLPSCGMHFQGRLLLGGTSVNPQTVYGSEFLNFQNFQTKTTNVVVTDPIEATSNELKTQIENLFGGVNALYALCGDGVAMINADQGIINPTDINFRLKNRVPAASMTPAVKDDIMFYLSSDKKKIYTVEFDWDIQRYNVNDITQHVQDYLQSEILELQFIERGSRLIYGSLVDGGWFVLLYDQSIGVAIFPFETSGQVQDLSVIKNGADYKLLMVVKRERGYVLEEKLPQEYPARQIFMTNDEEQEYSRKAITNTFYMDMVQKTTNTFITQNGFASFNFAQTDGPILSVDAPQQEQMGFHLNDYVGCEVYFYTQENTALDIPSYKVHVKIQEIIDASNARVIVFEDSDIQNENSGYNITSIKTQVLKIPVLEYNGTEFEIIGDDRYLGRVVAQDGYITLPKPCWQAYYGLPYEKIAIITETANPQQLKQWGSIALTLQDTLHLEIGADMKKLEPVVLYRPTGSQFNVVPRMTNGTIVKNIPDTDDYVKNLVLYSNKALPFCVIGLQADGFVADAIGN